MRRLLAVVCLALWGSVALAPAAGADPAKPGNYRSEVLRITPPTDAISAQVVGGDGFLELVVEPGHTVAVPGYTGEPWLRIDAAGTVEENQASSATFLNRDRFGSAENTDIPDWVSIENATEHPQWKVVARDGRYVWHDHRIHYMTPSIPPEHLPGTNRVILSDRDDGLWYVPLTVDGADHEILGELRQFPAPSPLPQWGIVVLAAALLGVAGVVLREPAARVAAGALVVVGGLALWVGAAELSVVPSEAGGNPIWVGLPIGAVVLALGALALRSAAARSIAVLASAAALAVWAVLRVPALDKAVPLGSLAPGLTRSLIALALGTAVGAVVAAIASGGLALRLADLDDDEDDGDDRPGAGSGEPAGTTTATDPTDEPDTATPGSASGATTGSG